MIFLEFFEALLGCAEVKGKRIQSDTDHQDQTVQNTLVFSIIQHILFQINKSL